MKIKIEEIEVSADQVKLVVNVKGAFSEENSYRFNSAIETAVQEYVVKNMAEEYLSKNMHEIVGKIDQRQILNLIALRTSGNLFENNR